MTSKNRFKRFIRIRVSAHISAQGYYIGTDRKGLTMINVNGEIYRGKPICNEPMMAAA